MMGDILNIHYFEETILLLMNLLNNEILFSINITSISTVKCASLIYLIGK